MQRVGFRHNEAQPTGGFPRQAFGSIADLLDACPDLGVLVRTYTDDTEPEALGEARARAVVEALAGRGVVTARLVAVSAGVHPDSDSAARPDRGDSYVRWADIEAVALADLPGGAPDLSDPDPFVVELWQDGRLRLDWGKATAADACARSAALVLRAATYNRTPLDVGCLAADTPATYTDASTADVWNARAGGVTVIDGRLGGTGVGWVVGPAGSVQTDGRFCARYLDARTESRRALAALVRALEPTNGADINPVGDRFPDERAALERTAAALLPFLDAVAAAGGEVEGVALDCRALTFEEYSH